MKENKREKTIILAIETSCDETAASVVENGRNVLSNIISSQIETHTDSGSCHLHNRLP
jgi:N6-L-threonylcarbamoyladenine synthase